MCASLACCVIVVELNPNFADAHSNLASVYKDSSRLKEAVHFYRAALALKPFFPDGTLLFRCCGDSP